MDRRMLGSLDKDAIFAAVRRNILEILPQVSPKAISPDKSLVDLGANSVDRMEVVTLTMEDLGVKIPLMSFAGVSDIGGLVSVLFENLR
jgi:polyketide biosynthesis acyl carrier protein